MGHSWGKIDHYGFVPFSYICPSFNKKTIRVSMITVNKKWLRLIGIVGCTVWMASCKQATDAGVKPSFAIMEVKAADKELSTSYSATIRGRQDIDIYPQVSGTIEKLCVTEGQTVRRGQLLFVIDQILLELRSRLPLPMWKLHVLQWRLPNSPTTAIKSCMHRK